MYDSSLSLHKNDRYNNSKSPSKKKGKSYQPKYLSSVGGQGKNHLNYIMVKEQQRMKKSRMKLLNTLDKQKFKFKFNTSRIHEADLNSPKNEL